MSKVDVNVAALRFAVDKKIGSGGRKDWWSGRGAACIGKVLTSLFSNYSDCKV